MEAWLHDEGWLPPHLSVSEVKFALATVVLFLPTVVVLHRVAVLVSKAFASPGAKAKKQG